MIGRPIQKDGPSDNARGRLRTLPDADDARRTPTIIPQNSACRPPKKPHRAWRAIRSRFGPTRISSYRIAVGRKRGSRGGGCWGRWPALQELRCDDLYRRDRSHCGVALVRLTDEIFGWLNQVKALSGAAVKVAFQLTQRINTKHFEREGEMITWQSHKTIGAELAMPERTVRHAIEQLVASEHLSRQPGHGPGRSTRYILLLDAATRCRISESQTKQKRQRVAASRSEIGQNRTRDTATADIKYGNGLPTNNFLNDLSKLRCRSPELADALGSLGARMEARIGSDQARAWFGQAVIRDATDDTITIEFPNSFIANRAQADHEAALLACCVALVPSIKFAHFAVARKGEQP